MRPLLLFALFLSLACPSLAQEPDAASLARRAVEAARGGDLAEALRLAEKAIKADGKRPEGWLARALVRDLQRDWRKASADYGEALKLDPSSARAWQRRGEAHFRAGEIEESITDFDRYLALVPDQKPHHWQRGISLYYAGRFREGKAQFEIHQTVNSNDVENAVWHFLCAARADGLESARRGLIPIEGDPRIPMAEVHRLFAGKGTVDDVLAAAERAPAVTRAGEPRFYADLYLGLYYEATGNREKAREHILKAAERSARNGYMGDVARVHGDRLRSSRRKD